MFAQCSSHLQRARTEGHRGSDKDFTPPRTHHGRLHLIPNPDGEIRPEWLNYRLDFPPTAMTRRTGTTGVTREKVPRNPEKTRSWGQGTRPRQAPRLGDFAIPRFCDVELCGITKSHNRKITKSYPAACFRSSGVLWCDCHPGSWSLPVMSLAPDCQLRYCHPQLSRTKKRFRKPIR